MAREWVDFGAVAEKHHAIHDRLVNWARWCSGNTRLQVAPMFRGVQAAKHWDGIIVRNEIDTIDAQFVEKAVSALPAEHRLALRWSYVYRTAPASMARAIGCSLSMLQRYVFDGRQMLVNRGT